MDMNPRTRGRRKKKKIIIQNKKIQKRNGKKGLARRSWRLLAFYYGFTVVVLHRYIRTDNRFPSAATFTEG